MSDQEDEFEKAFENFGKETEVKEDTKETKTEETKEVEQPEEKPEETKQPEEKPEDVKKPEDEGEEKPETPETKEEAPETPPETPKSGEETPEPTKTGEEAPEQPKEEVKPLTEDAMRSLLQDIRNEERNSTKEIESTTQEVLEAYYPEGLSNTLVDQNTGKELKTPQDVVEASGGEMSTEEATQWLMNEQYKLDREIDRIKGDIRNVAETTLKFKQDGQTVLQRYKPLFEAYPKLQNKVWSQYQKLVKADEEKGVVLSAPDMLEFYDTMLEPYRLAFEHSKQQSATAPTETKPEAPKPTVDDRLDVSGDGGATKPNDPNDFAQQVEKELEKGI